MASVASTSVLLEKYIRQGSWPTIWCSGCGIGTVMGALLRAIERLQLNQDEIVIGTGIGCSGFIYNYLNFDAFHGTHGRALAIATGIKIANPNLTVIVPMGDGDCAAIGGNHFIHAARRNIDLTAIIINNEIYGMTGGQYSPLTPRARLATTAPKGHLERPFDLCELAKAAGATYVARGTAYYVHQLIDLLSEAIAHKGFSVVEVIAQCPVQFGRRNEMPTAIEMLRWQRKHTVQAQRAAQLSLEELGDKRVIGRMVKIDAPEWTEEYAKVIEAARDDRADG
ncbi:MAG: thiamine pyrophosphate-dependent enzyme [Chloroflexi bacterium]|nr:thiamine pyrophosphate-dependent enzyme [Chloroflexota bacterium]MCL5074290.1 thiamine pyrophosphate-dependent enzyme [Chloroflexota bacterium]